MTKICVSGSEGKMGSRIIELAKEDPELEVAAGFDLDGNAELGITACECLIDFTSPKATVEHLELCEKLKKPIVIGTTGLSEEDKSKIKEASSHIPVVLSANMSTGVNLLFKLIEDASKVLGDEYEISILEAHHAEKKDSPSGTAKEMERIAKSIKGQDTDVAISSVREGEIVGEHTITFESDVDLIEITHSAKTRDIFAKGALKAAKFVAGKKSGLFTMKDVLNI
ncbi:MAG: 4-hydroxy-tetrahydrodipicolinate reductase, partial [Candidatus Omnitrophica bacterium]|nr:4-hydroxy-tetrahydrodipicolinate reductase [Candidatus Omnitrophota bacterium]